MSTSDKPIPELPIATPEPPPFPPMVPPAPAENPPWNLWDIAGLTIVFLLAMAGFVFGGAYFLHRKFAPSVPVLELTKRHEVELGAQFLAYLLALLVTYCMVSAQSRGRAWEAIRWNWPQGWGAYLAGGVTLQVGLLLLGSLLPMPKNAPIQEFFRTARDAWTVSVFGVLVAPICEEVYFRGLLYPALARWVGAPVSVVLTSLAFAIIHAPQLGAAWGPVLIIFLVGITLTTVRAVKKSVAATILMHMAYNGTIFASAFFATDGFKHMEKFT